MMATDEDNPQFEPYRLAGMVAGSTVMRDLFDQIDRIGRSNATVLIEGETGCGKGMVAEAIHHCSPRADGPFRVLDCSSVDDVSDEHMFEAAGGTLLLDHVGDLPVSVQPKLLRALESQRIQRVGVTTSHADVRIVAATNHDLARLVQRGAFRSDLYYRLAVAQLHVPPLRSRREDIPLLIDHFACSLDPGDGSTVTEEFLARAALHPWPGNVRELRNSVERHLMSFDHPMPEEPMQPATVLGDVNCGVPFKTAKQQLMDEFDRKYFLGLLEIHNGNLTAAARAAGIKRTSIYKVIRRLGVDHRDFVDTPPEGVVHLPRTGP
jgi:DNA-binding NtrC family response regulator